MRKLFLIVPTLAALACGSTVDSSSVAAGSDGSSTSSAASTSAGSAGGGDCGELSGPPCPIDGGACPAAWTCGPCGLCVHANPANGAGGSSASSGGGEGGAPHPSGVGGSAGAISSGPMTCVALALCDDAGDGARACAPGMCAPGQLTASWCGTICFCNCGG